jgi:hypothetical protein
MVAHPSDHEIGEGFAREAPAFGSELVAAIAEEIGRGDVERQRDVAAGGVAGEFDRLNERRQRVLRPPDTR